MGMNTFRWFVLKRHHISSFHSGVFFRGVPPGVLQCVSLGDASRHLQK